MTAPVPPRDEEHLQLLAVFHYVYAVLHFLSGAAGILFIMFAGLVRDLPPDAHGQPPPPFLGPFLVGLGVFLVLFFWAQGALVLVSGRMIARRKGRLLSLVMAGLSCMNMPIGTALGVFTFIVLLRPSVIALYDARRGDGSR